MQAHPEAPHDATQPVTRPWRHIALWVASLGVCVVAGVGFAGADAWTLTAWQQPRVMGQALAYALCVMGILSAHELGHYAHARRHEVEVSWPYFLPGVPLPGATLPLFGTFGAFIRMNLRPMSARALLEIGAWGPLAGFIVLVPVLLVGMSLSQIRPLPEDAAMGLRLGDSLLLWGAQRLFFDAPPPGHDVFLHPVAMAGWTGAFFTAFNLIPLGQLDGGHIAYTVLGDRFNRLAWWLFGGLVVLGVVAFPGWLMLALFLLVLRPTHPQILSGAPVRGREAWLAWASLAIFALTFTPRPIVVAPLWELVLGP